MADVYKDHDSTGIKLFGKLINVQSITKSKEEPITKSKIEDGVQSQTLIQKKPDKIMQCPRCKSMDTKFCYFNNYNVNQPRHFCKECHRYWTAGGALRNVPIGAGRRKAVKSFSGHGVQYLDDDDRRTSSTSGSVQFDGRLDLQNMAGYGCIEHLFPAKMRRNSGVEF